MKQNSVGVWDAFLNTLENRGLSSGDWEIEQDVQEKLIADFREKIDVGVNGV